MRHALILLLAAGLLLTASAAVAGDDEKTLDQMDGKELYRAECRPCHTEDSDNGEYTPMTLIADQWEEFFDDYYVESHSELKSVTDDSKTLTEVLDEEMLKKIIEFCVDHAADSEQPMTCG
jgi:hypothetical protein